MILSRGQKKSASCCFDKIRWNSSCVGRFICLCRGRTRSPMFDTDFTFGVFFILQVNITIINVADRSQNKKES